MALAPPCLEGWADSQPSSTVTKGTHIPGQELVMRRQEVGLSGGGCARGGNCSPSGGRGDLPMTWGPPVPELQHGRDRDLAAPRPPPLPARDLSGDIVPASWAAVGTIQHVLTLSLDVKVPWAFPSLKFFLPRCPLIYSHIVHLSEG